MKGNLLERVLILKHIPEGGKERKKERLKSSFEIISSLLLSSERFVAAQLCCL